MDHRRVASEARMDTLEDFVARQQPTAARPLLGLTVLVVEDSRFACEALRLLCLQSGARIRRADSLAAARRHLRVYRPNVLIADLGLPDGSGADIIADMATASPRIDVILGLSGDPGAEDLATRAGADGFLEKPLGRIAEFQSAILSHLPSERQPPGPRALDTEEVAPDPIALRDDLAHAADVLGTDADARTLDYLTQFLGGLARSVDDRDLGSAVARLKECRSEGQPIATPLSRVAGLVQQRLTEHAGF